MMNISLLLILNLCAVFTEFTEVFYDQWLENYRQVSGNVKPPNRYKEWINLATSMNVSVEPSVYKKIFENLAHFKNDGLTVEKVKDQLRRIKSIYPGRRDIIGFDRLGLSTSVLLKKHPYADNFILLSQVLDPSIELYLIVHNYDEGMIIPADDDQTERYTDMSDVFQRSSAMRKEWGDYANKCIHLQAPSSFHVIPFEAALFGINRLRGSKDILYATDATGILYYERFLRHALRAPTWENKRAVSIFRGSATGISYGKVMADKIPITNNPRYKLHEMTLLQRQGKLKCNVTLDFGVTNFNHWNNRQFIKLITSQFKEAGTMNYDDQFKGKYQVVVDGHGWPDRVAFFMASGSLVFLASLHEDWTMNQIIDGEHYIKVKPDLSDLVEKLEWAANNDGEAKRIAESGKTFALSKLRKPQVKIYNALLFMEFQTLFDKNNYPQNS